MKSINKMYQTILILFIALVFSFGFLGCDTTPELVKNDKVIILGDSLFALSGKIADDIEVYSGEAYRHYCISAAQMIGGVVVDVPDQYENAKADDPNIRTVIMDGGGNDILITNSNLCSGDVVSQECKDAIEPVFAEAERLFREFKDDGVKNIVYMGYYDVNPEGILVPDNGFYGVIDYAYEKSTALCDNLNKEFGTTMVGYYVDTRAAFEGHFADFITSDGVHPTALGSQVLADLIWAKMKANNIEQN
jgi:lysophospholipase L1-like esterase